MKRTLNLTLIDQCVRNITDKNIITLGDQYYKVIQCRRKVGNDITTKILTSLYASMFTDFTKKINLYYIFKDLHLNMPEPLGASCVPVYANDKIFSSEGLDHNTHLQKYISTKKISLTTIKATQILESFSTSSMPAVLHYVWVTNRNTPEEVTELFWKHNKYIEHNLEKTKGWTHYLWTLDIQIIPPLIMEKMANLSVEVKDLSELNNIKLHQINGKMLTDLAITHTYNGLFGAATDILRYLVIYKFGGFYWDGDYKLARNIDDLLPCNSVFGIEEPYNMYLGNGFIAAKAKHPVIEMVIKLVNRNLLQQDKAPEYIKLPCDFSQQTISTSGPVAISVAYAKAAKEGLLSYGDILLPYGIIFRHLSEEAEIESKNIEENKTLHVNNFIENYHTPVVGNDDFSSSWINH